MTNFPRIDEELVVLLEKLYQPLPYTENLSSEDFTRASAFSAGQVDVVQKIRTIYEKQQKERFNV
jgi:hypothetical protein